MDSFLRVFAFIGLFLLAACDGIGSTVDKPRLAFTAHEARMTQSVSARGDTLQAFVAEGDTVIFQTLREDPCLGGGRECTLPPLGVSTATTSDGAAQIRIDKGYFQAPWYDARLEGAIEEESREITILISLSDSGDGAHPDMPKGFLYEARVDDLTPGDYRLRIVHEHDMLRYVREESEDGRAVVLDTTLQVP